MSQRKEALLETLLIAPSNSEKRGEFVSVDKLESQDNAACGPCNGTCGSGTCKG